MKSCIEKKTCRNIEYIYSMTLLSEEKIQVLYGFL